ncbi:MAG: tetratricopeptide repeat protein [Bacteroidales bacterium]
MMKKIAIIALTFLFFVNITEAQKREVRKANRNLNKANFEEALTHINNALEDESTQKESDTWVLYTKILMEISASEDESVRNLVEDPLDKAYDAIQKAEELDEENKNMLEIQQTLLVLSEYFFNAAAVEYNEENFDKASQLFFKSYKVSESFESIDTSTLYNAGLSAEMAGNIDDAYEYYVETEEYDYDQPFLYSSLANISAQKENMEEATEWIKKGRERYPENLDLIFSEANIYLTTGNIPEAERVLEIAIERDPENPNLHYAFAVNYDQMSRDTLFSKEERQFAYQEAIKSYEKAIELKPDYFDAIYNLGALHFNEGIALYVEAEEILREDMDFEAYEEKEKEVLELWLEAQPYLEQAFEMIDEDDPNYEVVLRSLRELYMRTKQEEKVEEVNALWEEKFGSIEEEE